MKILVPSAVWDQTRRSQQASVIDNVIYGRVSTYIEYVEDTLCSMPWIITNRLDDLPSYLKDEKGNGEHYCFHAKPLTSGGLTRTGLRYTLYPDKPCCTSGLWVPRDFKLYGTNGWSYVGVARPLGCSVIGSLTHATTGGGNRRLTGFELQLSLSAVYVVFNGNKPAAYRILPIGYVKWSWTRSSGTTDWEGPLMAYSQQSDVDLVGVLPQNPVFTPSLDVTGNTARYDRMRSDPAVYNCLVEAVDRIISKSYAKVLETGTKNNNSYQSLVDVYATEAIQVPGPSSFYFYEVEDFLWNYPTFSQDFRRYWRRYLTQHAFLGACESIPRLNDNSISNILEVANFIYSLVFKHQIEIPKSLSDIWLTYRYMYSTGKSDAEEAISFVHRHMDLEDLGKEITCYGQESRYFAEIDSVVTCRCKVRVKPRNLCQFKKLWRDLATYGLTPDLYVLWDMTPFSFMVDWLLPIGDVLNVMDASLLYTGDFYDFSDITFSLKYENAGNSIYSRWVSAVPPELHSYYWFEKTQSSETTWAKRVLDVMSIFL